MLLKPLIHFATLSTHDLLGGEYPVHPTSQHLRAVLDWLCRAQDSMSDGGVSAYYSFFRGWSDSFIETTGYIIQTFIKADHYFPDLKLAQRAHRMAQFIAKMQLPNGGFRTYPPTQMVDSEPTVFNTGQDLLGMCDMYEFGHHAPFLKVGRKAGAFLVANQDADGAWRKYEVDTEGHTYHSRVGWALIRLGMLTNDNNYISAGEKALEWVLHQQQANGWYEHSGLVGQTESDPITHTIVYTIEGMLYGGMLLHNATFVKSAQKAIDQLLMRTVGQQYISATFNAAWEPMSQYECLTGTSQLATVTWYLCNQLQLRQYQSAAEYLTTHLKKRHPVKHIFTELSGGMAGSYPTYGTLMGKGYCRESQINWAAKFFADALLGEITYAQNVRS